MRLLRRFVVFAVMLALAGCSSGKLSKDNPVSSVSRQASAIGGAAWDCWGGDSFLSHEGFYGVSVAQMGSVQVMSMPFATGVDAYGAPMVLAAPGPGSNPGDDVYVTSSDAYLHRFRWNGSGFTYTNLGRPLDYFPPVSGIACMSSPVKCLDNQIRYCARNFANQTWVIGCDKTSGTIYTDFSVDSPPTLYASVQDTTPYSTLDDCLVPTEAGLVAHSESTPGANNIFVEATNVMVSASSINALNLAPAYGIFFDRQTGASGGCEIDCWWSGLNGEQPEFFNDGLWRYTTRREPTGQLLPGDPPGLGGSDQAAVVPIGNPLLAWSGQLFTSTSAGLFYVKADPNWDVHDQPIRLMIKAQGINLLEPCITAPAVMTPDNNTYYVAVVRDVSLTYGPGHGSSAPGSWGRLDVYQVVADYSNDMTLQWISPVWSSAPYASPTIFAPCLDQTNNVAWLCSSNKVYAYNISTSGTINPNPVYTSLPLGTSRSQPVMGGYLNTGTMRNWVYAVFKGVNGPVLYGFYKP